VPRAVWSAVTVPDVVAWARAEYARTGAWANMDSGPVAEAPGETWHGINADRRAGCRPASRHGLRPI
jgi:hypothetical protein